MITALIFGIIAYLIGSLSSAVIVCQLFGLPDPRSEGSMNPGTTNVLRLGGKTPAIITLVGDMLKGFLPVLAARLFGIDGFFVGLIALFAFLGHLFPVFFSFQGGKGVATALGASWALSPMVGFMMCICWLLVAATSRYSSLASIVAMILVPILVLLFAYKAYFLPVLAIAIMLIWRHTENIQRLCAGVENKISF